MEYTGDMTPLFSFIKPFIKFAMEICVVIDSEGRVLNALEDRFGIKLVESNYNDPDCAGFIRSVCKADIVYV